MLGQGRLCVSPRGRGCWAVLSPLGAGGRHFASFGDRSVVYPLPGGRGTSLQGTVTNHTHNLLSSVMPFPACPKECLRPLGNPQFSSCLMSIVALGAPCGVPCVVRCMVRSVGLYVVPYVVSCVVPRDRTMCCASCTISDQGQVVADERTLLAHKKKHVPCPAYARLPPYCPTDLPNVCPPW